MLNDFIPEVCEVVGGYALRIRRFLALLALGLGRRSCRRPTLYLTFELIGRHRPTIDGEHNFDTQRKNAVSQMYKRGEA